MKVMKHTLFTLSLALLVSIGAVQAQIQVQEKTKIAFDKTTHEFGNLEKNKKAETTFYFTNTSDAPVTLKGVKASCGCTTPSWTRDAVNPGEKGEIVVGYNAAAAGPFTKSVTVTYDDAEKPIMLYIKGGVDAPAGSSVIPPSAFPNVLGGLAFDRLSATIGELDSDKESRVIFQVQNVSPLPIRFDTQHKHEHEAMFDVQPADAEILPGAKTTLTITVLGNKFITPGPFSQTIHLHTNDPAPGEKTLTITGSINKVVSAEERAQAPHIQFEQLAFDGGKVIEGEQVEYKYVFTNTGKQDLVIESVKASCGCTATAPKDDVIKPGQSSEIVATFDSRGRVGKQSKSVTVMTNDPDQSATVLRFELEVVKDPFHIGGGGMSPVAAPGGN